MNEQDVTDVTRNNVDVDKYAELKVVFDLITWVGMLYVMTHPDAFEQIGEKGKAYWSQFVHRVSIWTARQDIRSLPETEE